jgi:nitroimidazol reductase NimA-like FMN-containing flavoprotein (pyridoxamine 5'-phosphate oxidase superfamily)
MDSAGAPDGIAAPDLEQLDPAECRRLLGRGGVGRLALRGSEAPEIRPVNFALVGDRLIVRTGDGSILAAARAGEAAGFEIDEIDRLEHTGFSVVARGRLSVLPSDASLLALPVRPWASGLKDRFVGLSLEHVSGLRIPPGRGNR